MDVYHYDVFTKIANKGNPAGVVMDADNLSSLEMQEIAAKVGFNETAFVMQSDKADIKIRYFTPGHEMNLCGHGTLATLYAIYDLTGDATIKTIETKAGILAVDFIENEEKDIRIRMDQSSPRFMKFTGSKLSLAESIGIERSDIDDTLPIVYGNTGTWTLLLPIKNLDVFNRMVPQNTLFPEILHEIPKCSIHPFCFETYQEDCMVHARHFSSPFSGTIEDAVTGTASGVIGAYYMNYVSNTKTVELIVEQGHELQREGKVYVHVVKEDDAVKVSISGYCTFNKVLKL